MPDRLIRDELLDSDRWLALPRNTHRLGFVCLLLRCDALGNVEAGDGSLWRLWHEPLALTDRGQVAEILGALIGADLVRLYGPDGQTLRELTSAKRFAHIPRTRFHLRYVKQVCPLSPWTTDEQKQRLSLPITPSAHREHTARTPSAPQGVGVGVNASFISTALPLSTDSARASAPRSTAGEKKREKVNGTPAQRVQQLAAGLAARLTAPTSARPPAAQRVPGKPAPEWWRTEAGIEREGKRRNLPAKPGESWRDWALRLRATPEPT